MHRILLLTLLFLSALLCHSQFNLELSQVYGGNSLEEAIDIAINHDSSALFFGSRTFSTDGDVPGNNGGSDFWIMKRSIAGDPIWSHNYGGFNNDDLAAVMPHTDGGVIAFGTTRNDHGDFGDLKGLAGGWLIRISNMGVITRGKIFGDQISENAIDAIRHPNGDVTMLIEASSTELDGQLNNGVLDVWVVQVDAAFNIKWTNLLGGARHDTPSSLTTDADGNIYVAASSESNLPGLPDNAGENDVWIFKLSPEGELLWQETFGGSGDDLSNDILYDPAGNVYVIAQSYSQDGDFNINRGFSDLWLIKLNAESGNPLLLKTYGGMGTEADANIAWLGNSHMVVSATTNSDSFDISSNKGFNDVWVFMINLSGNIQLEMNYGGSHNDLAGDLLVSDSVLYLFNSTLSSDKNVPPNIISQQDLWFMTLNTNPDTCSFQFLCEQDSTLSNELFPPSTEVLVCVSGCTAGLQTGPDFIQGSCPDFIHGTAYYKLSTDINADLLTLSVESDEFNEPHIALLRTSDCNTFTQIACAQGKDGHVIIPYIDVEPATAYVLAVSDAAGNVGDFELCASVIDVEFCNEKDKIYVTSASMGSPLSGPFLPGELVQICYELEDWNKLDCNGFQGLIPTFGPGWDPEGFDFFGQPVQVDTFLMPVSNGFWDWYKVGDVHYNFTNPIGGFGGGQGMAPGWYFTNLGDAPPNDNPDQTTGDINDCTPTPDKWKVCFTLPVEDECESNMDLTVSMRTFSDGELGVNISLACLYDQPEVLNIGMVCCINPTVQNIPERSICSGDTLVLFPETNILPPVTYSWMVSPDPGILGATAGNEQSSFYQILHNETDEIKSVNYVLWAEGINCEAEAINFTVNVYPLPTSRITISGPSTVCSGSTVTLNFENKGTPPFAIEVTRDNQFFANILSETFNISVEVDPVLSGRFRVGSMRDKFCDGEGLGFVNVTVKPVGSNLIDTSSCEGDSITIGMQTFHEPGTYIINLEDAAANNCDSVISLSYSIIPSLTQQIDETICNGDTIFVLGVPYTETISTVIEYTGELGCPDFIELDLVVVDTFMDELEQTICGGDTLDFEGIAVFETGTYSHVEETSPGCFFETILNLTVLPAMSINDLAIMGDHGINDGAILVEIIGGSPPYTFLWNTGQTTGSLMNIMHGNYTLTVTDRLGCSETFNFTVPMVTSSVDINDQDVSVWPTIVRPSGKLYLSLPEGTLHQLDEIHLWDASGRAVSKNILHQAETGSLASISIPGDVPSGLYFISYTREGNSSWHKIIVEK